MFAFFYSKEFPKPGGPPLTNYPQLAVLYPEPEDVSFQDLEIFE
jgi:hypothetical protein